MGLYKKFCLKFLASVLAISAGVAAFNIIVDPYEFWNVYRAQGFNMLSTRAEELERLQKPLDFLMLKEKPETVFIGTSQMIYAMDMEEYKALSGKSAYNFSLRGGTMYEQRRVLEHVLANDDKLKDVYIGIVYANFISCSHHRHQKVAGEFAEEDEQYGKTYVNLDSLGKTLFSWNAVKDSVNKILDNHKNQWEHPYYMPSGKVYDDNVDSFVQRSNWEFTRTLALMKREGNYRDCQLAQDSFDELAYMMELCRERGVEVHLFICPVHAQLMEALAADWDVYEDWKRAIVKMAPVMDFSGYNELTMSPVKPGFVAEDTNPYFWDVMHMKTSVGNGILACLLGQATPEESHGQLLTPQNIEEHLAGLRAKRDAWAQAHPDNVEMIRYFGGFSDLVPTDLQAAKAADKGMLAVRLAGKDEPIENNKWRIGLVRLDKDAPFRIELTQDDRVFVQGIRFSSLGALKNMYALLESEQGHRYYALTEPTRDVQVADFMNSHIYDENGFVLNAPVWDLPTGTYALSFVEVYEDGSVRLAEKLGTVEVKEPAGE